MRFALGAVAVLLGCNSSDGDRAAPAIGDGTAADAAVLGPSEGGGGGELEPDKLAPEPGLPTESGEPPESLDLDQAVENLGAIPAWQAVIDRNQYLRRRNQSAVVFGKVGGPVPLPVMAPAPGAPGGDAGVAEPPPVSDLTWLIDETEGNGALAIRVRFGVKTPAVGDRVAVSGAWEVDDAERWLWQAAGVTPLPPGEIAAPVDPPVVPGLVVATLDPPGPRAKLRSPTFAREGDLMEFVVTEAAPRHGDGWSISDRRWGEVMAFLVLPGERDSYGGHDLRQQDERWTLKKNGHYWVRVGKVRKPKGKTTIITAATAPIRDP